MKKSCITLEMKSQLMWRKHTQAEETEGAHLTHTVVTLITACELTSFRLIVVIDLFVNAHPTYLNKCMP